MSSGGDAVAVSLVWHGQMTKWRRTGSHRPQASPEGLPSTCWEG